MIRFVAAAAKNNAEGYGEAERIMIRVKSNIGPSGGGFGYHIDMAPLHEQPDVEATRIVWELPLEGTARDLLNSAEGEQDGKITKLDEAKRFLRTALTGDGHKRKYSPRRSPRNFGSNVATGRKRRRNRQS